MLQYGLISSSSSAQLNCWSWNCDDSPASTCSAEYHQIQASHSSYSSSANSITEAKAWLAFTVFHSLWLYTFTVHHCLTCGLWSQNGASSNPIPIFVYLCYMTVLHDSLNPFNFSGNSVYGTYYTRHFWSCLHMPPAFSPMSSANRHQPLGHFPYMFKQSLGILDEQTVDVQWWHYQKWCPMVLKYP